MANEMIERVALAMYVNDWTNSPNAHMISDNHYKSLQNKYIRFAKAAIEAMREPTDDQRKEYYELMKKSGNPLMGSVFVDALWERMIDAALKD